MANISNDQALRAALNRMTAEEQRLIGARFAERVSHLCIDERVKRAIATALNAEATPAELADAFKAAKSYSVKTYTDCGKDTDWMAQADHFVAASITAALTPDELMAERQNRAWKAALHARMAINCAMIEDESISENDESAEQYAIANSLAD